MIYYVLIYWIKKYAVKYIPHIIALTGVVALLVYALWFPYKYETGEKGLYGITTLFRWIPYFAFMLFGSWMGLKRKNLKFHAVFNFLKMIASLFFFYGIQFAAMKYAVVAPYQIITLLPLMGIVYYFYKWCHADFWKKLYFMKIGYVVIMTVSGLCLESYLIQYSCFTTKMNDIYPLNLPMMILIVLFVSFVCKCLARLFSQTFEKGEYNWREVIKLC